MGTGQVNCDTCHVNCDADHVSVVCKARQQRKSLCCAMLTALGRCAVPTLASTSPRVRTISTLDRGSTSPYSRLHLCSLPTPASAHPPRPVLTPPPPPPPPTSAAPHPPMLAMAAPGPACLRLSSSSHVPLDPKRRDPTICRYALFCAAWHCRLCPLPTCRSAATAVLGGKAC